MRSRYIDTCDRKPRGKKGSSVVGWTQRLHVPSVARTPQRTCRRVALHHMRLELSFASACGFFSISHTMHFESNKMMHRVHPTSVAHEFAEMSRRLQGIARIPVPFRLSHWQWVFQVLDFLIYNNNNFFGRVISRDAIYFKYFDIDYVYNLKTYSVNYFEKKNRRIIQSILHMYILQYWMWIYLFILKK